ncbi:MAG: hypothetical protein WCL08_10220, partial [Verrucomicrobiota bacterium]
LAWAAEDHANQAALAAASIPAPLILKLEQSDEASLRSFRSELGRIGELLSNLDLSIDNFYVNFGAHCTNAADFLFGIKAQIIKYVEQHLEDTPETLLASAQPEAVELAEKTLEKIYATFSKIMPLGTYPGSSVVLPQGIKLLERYIEDHWIGHNELPRGVHEIPGGSTLFGHSPKPQRGDFDLLTRGFDLALRQITRSGGIEWGWFDASGQMRGTYSSELEAASAAVAGEIHCHRH